MTSHSTAPLLGFAFIAACIGFDIPSAVLCLLGALVFRVGAGLVSGELELDDLRERVDAARSPRGSRVG
jgi:hypothetical protein